MAEALLRHHAGDRFEACSAGLDPTAVHPVTHRVLAEIGVESSRLRAKPIKEFLGNQRADYAIMVCEADEQTCPRIYPFALHILQWPFEDPATPAAPEVQLAAFRLVRDQIDARIRVWVKQTT
jgi:arsenate reductase